MKNFLGVCVCLLMAVPAFAQQCNNLASMQPMQPCASVNNDLNCIRSYFVGSRCNLQNSMQISDNLYVAQDALYYPYFNITVLQSNVRISGISTGVVVSFIVDYQTDIIQITTRYTDLEIRAAAVNTYLQPQSEPIRFNFPETLVKYNELDIITVFNSAARPDLRDSFTLASTVSTANYDLGVCSLPANQPPVVQQIISAFLQRNDVNGPEGLLTRSPNINVDFIQKSICDFGIDASNRQGEVPVGIIN